MIKQPTDSKTSRRRRRIAWWIGVAALLTLHVYGIIGRRLVVTLALAGSGAHDVIEYMKGSI